jgi:hypothetical protein
MLKYLLFSIATVSLLAGCSSTPEQVSSDQYCYTNETITNSNGIVNSTTVVECSDDPVQIAKRQGIDFKTCRKYQNPDAIVNGYRKTIRGILCYDENGNVHRFPSN